MKISGVKIRVTSPYSFRYREWATLLSVSTSFYPTTSYKCIYHDGFIDHIPVCDSNNYEIKEGK